VALDIREAGASVTFPVRVRPRAGRDEIAGERSGALLVRLNAPPVEGAANAALCRLLARALDLAPSRVELLRGSTGRDKLVRVTGTDAARVRALAEAGA
jgi:uncharacterized protein